MTYRVAVIGTGPDPETKSREGYAMGYRHGKAYAHHSDCTLTAAVDLVPQNVHEFADTFDISHTFSDQGQMLSAVNPEIVSICVPPDSHAELVKSCADHPSVKAIHCEKPMATAWKDSQEMVANCKNNGVQLTIGHQRRFARPVRKAKSLLDKGAIGNLTRLEWSEVNLFDAGSHLFDLCDYMTDGRQVEWVLAGVECEYDNRWFGVLNETRSIAPWKYKDGIMAFASTAENGATLVESYLRLVGTDGVIEIAPPTKGALRMRNEGEWSVTSSPP